METKSNMEKKSLPRGSVSKNGTDAVIKSDYNRKRNHRKQRDDKNEFGKRQNNQKEGRAGMRIVRSREKVGSQVNLDDYEDGAVKKKGGKSRDISHLMSWYCPGSSDQRYRQNQVSSGARKKKPTHHAYNKDRYRQFNCQYVIHDGMDSSGYEKDPDLKLEWELVEDIRVHRTDPPNCPICLYPPVAGKMTKCGHIFCFQCILHYLALSDDDSRNCPICFVPVAKSELKSVVVVLHQELNYNEEVSFSLMYRERDSTIPNLMSLQSSIPCSFSTIDDISIYSRIITASKRQIQDQILAREYRELTEQLYSEKDEPEACFIEQALALVQQREILLSTYPERKCSPKLLEDSMNALCLEETRKTPVESQNKNSPKSIFYFYQASNGLHFYLNSLNVQMLSKEYGSIENCPPIVKGIVIQKESLIMDDNLKNRTRYLSHLPMFCPYEMIELKLTDPVLSEAVIGEFQDRLDKRARERKRREKEEKKVERRAKKEEDKVMGRSGKGMDVHLNSLDHFPSFAEDPPLLPSSPISPTETLSSSSSSGLSFVDMVRSNDAPFKRNVKPIVKETPIQENVGSNSEDEGLSAPDYSVSYAKGLEEMFKLAALEGKNNGTKKKKKKKNVVLVSTWG